MRFHRNNPLIGCLGQLCTTDWSLFDGMGRGCLGALPTHPQIQEVAFVGYQDPDDHPVGADATIPFGEGDYLPVFVKPDGSAVRLGRGKQATSESDFLVDANTQKFLVITDSPTMFADLQVPVADDMKAALPQGPLAVIQEQATYGAFPIHGNDQNVPFVLTENLKPGATMVIGRTKLPDSIGVSPDGKQLLRYFYWIGFSKDYREELAETTQAEPTTPTPSLPPAGPSVKLAPSKKPVIKPASSSNLWLYLTLAAAFGIGLGIYHSRKKQSTT